MEEVAEKRLPQRFLGNSGLKVSTICLGAMTFGVGTGESRPGQSDEPMAHAMLDRFVEAGGNFIDTADIYQFGVSEEIIGKWLVKNPHLRSRVIIATKVWGPMEKDDVNARGLSRHHITQAVEQSLSRLRTDYIDLYQTHCWDNGTPLEETLRALDDLVRAGKVHYVGVSNVTGWQFQRTVDMCRELGLNQIVSNQAQYNLLCRSTEWELLEVCKREGVAMLPWSPLKGGLLTGKFSRGVVPDDPSSSRVAWVQKDNRRKSQSHPSLNEYSGDEQFWNIVDALGTVAKAHEATSSQIAISWLLHQPAVSSVIIGARTLEQLDENMESAHIKLTEDELDLLNKKSKPLLPYPYEMVFRLQKGREKDY